MTRAPRLVVITGLPGAGKSSTARELVKLLKWLNVLVTRILRFITRPYRDDEEKGEENLRVSVKWFSRMEKARKLFHPTHTPDPLHGRSHSRAFPHMGTWRARPGTDIMLIVTGPRAALEILDKRPDASVFFLTAPRDVLVQRIIDRGSLWGTTYHPKKIHEYDTMYDGLGIEWEYRRRGIPIIDTKLVDTAVAVARRILEMLGYNPLALKMIDGDSNQSSS